MDETVLRFMNKNPLLQLEKIGIESLPNETVILDNAGAYESPKTEVEDLCWFGRNHTIQVICLAHCAKELLPIVRENCFKIFITKKQLKTATYKHLYSWFGYVL